MVSFAALLVISGCSLLAFNFFFDALMNTFILLKWHVLLVEGVLISHGHVVNLPVLMIAIINHLGSVVDLIVVKIDLNFVWVM